MLTEVGQRSKEGNSTLQVDFLTFKEGWDCSHRRTNLGKEMKDSRSEKESTAGQKRLIND